MYQENVNLVTLTAGAAVAARRFVKVSTGGKVIQCAADTDHAVGVSAEAAAGDLSPIGVVTYNGGIAMVEAGNSVTVGSAVCSDSTGRALAAATGDRLNGWALTGAGGAGEIISVLMVKGADLAA